nr:S-adenosylmethionine carrier 1, chloroplastic/mitochondrial [Ipomoea batatas]
MGPITLAVNAKNSFVAPVDFADASNRKMENLPMNPRKFFASINKEEEKPFDFFRILFGMFKLIVNY